MPVSVCLARGREQAVGSRGVVAPVAGAFVHADGVEGGVGAGGRGVGGWGQAFGALGALEAAALDGGADGDGDAGGVQGG